MFDVRCVERVCFDGDRYSNGGLKFIRKRWNAALFFVRNYIEWFEAVTPLNISRSIAEISNDLQWVASDLPISLCLTHRCDIHE